jgi:hypothetical protein
MRRSRANAPPGATRAASTLATAVLIASATLAATERRPVFPEPPRLTVEIPPVASGGRTIEVPDGGDLQDALDAARPGDTIALAPGAIYNGPFVLKEKKGPGWILVRGALGDSGLPPPGGRVDPAGAARMPKLVAATDAVVTTAPRAHHYRFVGVEIRPREGVFLKNLVLLGAGAGMAVDDRPDHLIFDRCYIHGDPRVGARRGIALNARHVAVVDSYLSDFKEVGADAQAIAGWDGPGPFRIEGNYLEASGENLIFGGADPSITAMVPSDIVVRRNHLAKALAWRPGDPAYAGVPWTVKNLLELKNARRVLIEGNLLERNWAGAQNGYAILFTVRDQDGGAPWSAVEDVTFSGNLVRRVTSGINILGHDDLHPSGPARRLLIRNNLFDEIGGAWGAGQLVQMLNGADEVRIERNTAFQSGGLLLGGESAPHRGFVFIDNIAPHNAYGIIGSGTGVGMPSIDRYFPSALIRGNVIAGGRPAIYPPGNAFPTSLDAVGFVDRGRGDDRLSTSSPYRGSATDGGDPGADLDALCAALGPQLAPRDAPPLCPAAAKMK